MGDKKNSDIYVSKLPTCQIVDYWICRSCYKKFNEWSYECDNCQEFDSLYWYE